MFFLRNIIGVLIILLIANDLCSSAKQRFLTPVQGEYGKDFIIVNYVDWESGTGILDCNCLTKTYDGHQGTDYVIRDFSVMDQGVNVLAVDSGTVFFIQDGLYDRENKSDVSKKLGNFIGILHSDKLQTYYAHLKNNSILVSPGDIVAPGQIIAQIGSSGNSMTPHLHFEMWYDSTYNIDPFSGSCGNDESYWIDELPYDSSFNVWNSGMLNFSPSIDTLQVGLSKIDTFYTDDSAISYWSLIYGLRTNDSLEIKWFSPNNKQWFSFKNTIEKDWWFYYYWTYINTPPATKEGFWRAEFYRNDLLVDEQSFYFMGKVSSISAVDNSELMTIQNQLTLITVDVAVPVDIIRLLDLRGNIIAEKRVDSNHCVFEKKLSAAGVVLIIALRNGKIIATEKVRM